MKHEIEEPDPDTPGPVTHAIEAMNSANQQIVKLQEELSLVEDQNKDYGVIFDKYEVTVTALQAHCDRMDALLTGATREATADKIFAAAEGKWNTRSVWILADELQLKARTTGGQG
jgi:hypothetical protein